MAEDEPLYCQCGHPVKSHLRADVEVCSLEGCSCRLFEPSRDPEVLVRLLARGLTATGSRPSAGALRRRLRFAARRLYQFDSTWDLSLIDYKFGVADTIDCICPPGSDLWPDELASAMLSLAEEVGP